MSEMKFSLEEMRAILERYQEETARKRAAGICLWAGDEGDVCEARALGTNALLFFGIDYCEAHAREAEIVVGEVKVNPGEHDVGSDVVIRWDADGRGFAWHHPACRAWATLRFVPDPASTGHQLLRGGPAAVDGLTVGGSLLCPMGCGTHGVIEDGRWRSV